ncbi:MAG: protein kinase [Phycisphaerales bacterium JB059]
MLAACGSDAERQEVVRADARRRWRAGLDASVEHYERVLPSFAPDSDVAVMLIALELAEGPGAGSATAMEAVRHRLGEAWAAAFIAAKAEMESSAGPDPEADDFGRYVIRSPLGEGGFGVVYLAERREGYRQRVALKVLKKGMDSRRVLARFEAERQALAQMDHPGIARIFDAGISRGGVPFFVMEYVRGEPITSYCDRHRLGTRQRLAMFRQVCEAVQHAHQRGVIHRDIKPGNVLVTIILDRPIVKIIDFGVAKAIEARLGEDSVMTEQGQILGTPEYMSPEQAEMGALDIDTRTDVYSLGVLLYELIVGVRPFNLRQRAMMEIQRIIREEEPPRPSTQLSSLGETAQEIASRRATTLAALRGELHRELEWIPLKAMRKDRTERYRTPMDLSDDLGAYLEGRALQAGPESGWYRARKFLRRNRKGVLTTALFCLVLMTATVFSTWQAVRATRAQTSEREQRRVLERVDAFVNEDLLAVETGGDPGGGRTFRTADYPLSEVYHAVLRGERLGRLDREAPRVAARIRRTIGLGLERLGDLPEAQTQLVAALEVIDRVRPALTGDAADDMDRLMFEIQTALARLRWRLEGDAPRAVEDLEALLSESQERFGEHNSVVQDVRLELANARTHAGDHEGAIRAYDRVIVALRDLVPADDPAVLSAAYNRALAMNRLRRFKQALAEHRRVLSARERVLGSNHISTLNSLTEVGFTLNQLNRLDEAREVYAKLLPALEETLGMGHWRTLQARANRGLLLEKLGRPDLAATELRLALEGAERSVRTEGYRSSARWGPGSDDTLTVARWLVRTLVSVGRCAEARRVYEESLDGAVRSGAGDSAAFDRFVVEGEAALCDPPPSD